MIRISGTTLKERLDEYTRKGEIIRKQESKYEKEGNEKMWLKATNAGTRLLEQLEKEQGEDAVTLYFLIKDRNEKGNEEIDIEDWFKVLMLHENMIDFFRKYGIRKFTVSCDNTMTTGNIFRLLELGAKLEGMKTVKTAPWYISPVYKPAYILTI